MFNPPHFGLYFTQEHVEIARKERDREPFRAAWQQLRQREQTGTALALWHGLRFRFDDDYRAGESALNALTHAVEAPINADHPYIELVSETMMAAQAYELLRAHRAFEPAPQARWRDAFYTRVTTLDASPAKDTFTEALWMGALALVAGIVLEREPVFQAGVGVFQEAVANDVRPQGFIPRAVEGGDGGGMFRQVLSASALVLMAEAAYHAGVDLWGFSLRGVSAATAAMYPIYYFYTTDKWKWDPNLSVDDVQSIFRRHGGYLEILHRRTRHKDLKPLLDDLRPVIDLGGGGLTTLSHGVAGRRGLFG